MNTAILEPLLTNLISDYCTRSEKEILHFEDMQATTPLGKHHFTARPIQASSTFRASYKLLVGSGSYGKPYRWVEPRTAAVECHK